MEQNRPKQTDQQATNAALAALAAAGNAFALGQLWEVNKGFIRRQLWQWYEKNKPIADNAGRPLMILCRKVILRWTMPPSITALNRAALQHT